MLQLHKPQENPYIQRLYEDVLDKPGSETAHKLLHTEYSPKKRINESDVRIAGTPGTLPVTVCLGTSCFIRGSQKLMRKLGPYLEGSGMAARVEVKATFCHEKCERGPIVTVAGEILEKATFEDVVQCIENKLAAKKEA
jgi:NADH-quinone oxidoreductase subunit G